MAWPSIETPEDYRQYEQAFRDGIHGLTFLSTGSLYEEDIIENGGEEKNICFVCYREEMFSHLPCIICSRPWGGSRYPAHALVALHGEEVRIHLDVCSDCLYYINYGCLDDTTMSTIRSKEG